MVLVTRLWSVLLATRVWSVVVGVVTRSTVLKTLRVTYTTTTQEQKLCTTLPLMEEREEYIVTFDPKANSEQVVHLSIQVCGDVPSKDRQWSCDVTPSCVGRGRPVYVWSMNSSTWTLPPETAMPVGGSPEERYLVLVAHIRKTSTTQKVPSPHLKSAQIVLRVSRQRPRFEVGLMVLGNTGYIPADTKKFVSESACQWRSHQSALILGYRLHSNQLGRWMEGFKVTDGDWQLIGQGKPISSENVHRSFKNQILEYDDYLVSRCYYENSQSKQVTFGPGYDDEVCSLHILYIFPYGASPTLRFRACIQNSQKFHLTDVFHKIPQEKSRISENERRLSSD